MLYTEGYMYDLHTCVTDGLSVTNNHHTYKYVYATEKDYMYTCTCTCTSVLLMNTVVPSVLLQTSTLVFYSQSLPVSFQPVSK